MQNLTKRQIGLLIAGGILMLLAGLCQIISEIAFLKLVWGSFDILMSDLWQNIQGMLPSITGTLLLIGAFTVSAAGAFTFKWKTVQSIALVLAAVAVLITAILWKSSTSVITLVCFVLLAVGAFMRGSAALPKLAPVFGYLPMLVLLVSAFDVYKRALLYNDISAYNLLWLCTDGIMALALLVLGAGIAGGKGGKAGVVFARIGLLGIPCAPLALLLYGIAPSLPGAGYAVLLVLSALVLLAGMLLLPLCVVYPLFNKKKAAVPAAE